MAAIYCNRCGCENSSDRSACVRCLNLLRWPAGGTACGNCGADNVGHAQYCANCGSPQADAEPADDWSLAAAIGVALGGDAEIGPVEEDEDYVGAAEGDPEAVPDLDFEESAGEEELALEEVGDEAEPPMFEPAEAAADAEEVLEMPPPPPELDEVEEDGADSEFASLSPEDDAPEASSDDLAALALELADEPEEPEAEEVAPLPSLPDSLEFDEVAEEAPAAEPAEAADEGDEDSVLGGWALDIDDE